MNQAIILNSKSVYLVLLICWLPSFGSMAQTTNAKTDSLLIGTWKGSSLCQQKNSPCHDESVVYHISRKPGNDTLFIQADKIVNGAPLDMGTLPFLFDPKTNRLESNSYGTWSFLLQGNHLEGTLIDHGTLYRKISLTKVP